MKDRIRRLTNPHKIQEFLDSIPYSSEDCTRSAAGAIEMGRAHCFDGALIAAAALEFHSHPPLIMDLTSNGNDDDHVLAVYRFKGHYGAIAKSNFVGLRFREPVYRSLRELALSYFNSYINLKRERTLLKYSRLVNLSKVQTVNWRSSPAHINIYNPLVRYLERTRHYRLFPKTIEKALGLADRRLLSGETVGLDRRGVYI